MPVARSAFSDRELWDEDLTRLNRCLPPSHLQQKHHTLQWHSISSCLRWSQVSLWTAFQWL